MNPTTRPVSQPPDRRANSADTASSTSASGEFPSPYGPSFWFAYAANSSVMVLATLLFRYSDFVYQLGGTELELGWIVGIGTIGSLAMRGVLGVAIDRRGTRQIWLLSLFALIVSLLCHLRISNVHGPAIYLVRMGYHTALAGAFGASLTYISKRAPTERMAELIGMLGSSGFVGMIIGTQLGDLICGNPVQREQLDCLFVLAAGLATFAFCCTAVATREEIRPTRRKQPPMVWLLRRYFPGRVLLMGVVAGFGLGLPGTFLRPLTASLGIQSIGVFFGCYAVTAFSVRLRMRRLPEKIGIRPTILLGMASLVISMLLYLTVQSPWQLSLPGIAAGVAHALLFPSLVAGGSQAFPVRYRGLGTTLMLAMLDLGNLVGMPIAGTVVYLAGASGLPAYPTMFLTVATLVTLASGIYAVGLRLR